MDARSVTTENGAPCLATTSSASLDMFFKLVRDCDRAAAEQMFWRAVAEATTPELKGDLVVLAFHLRGTRQVGKGEKALSYLLLNLLAGAYGDECILAVLSLLPAFGYWKDLLQLVAMEETPEAIRTKCVSLLAEQLRDDEAELKAASAAKRPPSLSLAAKYAPREGSSFDRKEKRSQAKLMAKQLFGGEIGSAASARKYRQLCSKLNKALDTTECKMSAGRWEEINFSRVASVCLQRHRKAFLNEKLKGALTPAEEATGNRHPDDEARVAARVHLREAMLSKKGVSGKCVAPHELVTKCMRGSGSRLSTVEADLINAQWNSLREATRTAMAQAAEQRELEVAAAAAPAEAAAAASAGLDSVAALKAALPKHVDLGKLVPLVDVSGSMTGTPMQVAIALGILVSELTAPTFKDRVLTFESVPNWVDLSDCASLLQKVAKCEQAPWGGSTDFEAACERILLAAQAAKLSPDEIPDLIVFSDMQFNQARGDYGGYGYSFGYGQRAALASWETHYERIQRRFAEVGRATCGAPWAAPRIIFWNLRGNTPGFPVDKDAPNVQMLSGFSPALLKLVLTGADLVAEEREEVQPDGTVKIVKSGPSPASTYRAALDDKNFDVVRLKLAELETGPFKDYKFVVEEDGFELVEASDGEMMDEAPSSGC